MKLSPGNHARWLAIRRRFSLLLGRDYDPYPVRPAGVELNGSAHHQAAYEMAPRQMAWRQSDGEDPAKWQAMARTKLAELCGYDTGRETPNIVNEATVPLEDGLTRRVVYLHAGAALDIPVSIVFDGNVTNSKGCMICLQGTNSGAHLSWGETRLPADPLKIAAGGDFARQAVARGYIAICVEQRGFGERRELAIKGATSSVTAANHAYLLGRSLVGERASDVSTVVDWLESGPAEVPGDTGPIYVMGSSSGGTSAVYAAALDERLSGVIASGCIGYIGETILQRYNEGQAVVPGILNYFEFDDVVSLIAPRPFVGVSGQSDHIFPFEGCDQVVQSAADLYRALGAENSLTAVSGTGGHRFYPEIAWPAFEQVLRADNQVD